MNIILSKKTLSQIIISFAIIIILSPLALQADFLSKEKKEEYNANLNTIAGDADFSTEDSLEQIIGTIIRVVLASLGTVFLILMFLAGNDWMRSSGNKEKVQKAQAKIKSLVIGLILILSAYALSYWISAIFARVLAN